MNDSTAVAMLRDRIAIRARDPRLLLVPGLADDLRSIGDAFGALDRSQQLLARAALALRHDGYNIPQRDWTALFELARDVVGGR